MSERNHTRNSGTGLLGPNFSRRNRQEPTDDTVGEHRWIAIDESGYHGDQLHGGDRYMILGSVAIDDSEAAAIVDTLRREAGIQKSAPEVKFQKMFTGGGAGQRRRLLGELLAPDGPLHDRASVYAIDKHYFVAAKLVDLLLEERFHALGYDIVGNGVGRQLALDLAIEGPRALGRDGFDRLIATAVGFFSKKNRKGDHVTVDAFYAVIRESYAYARRRKAPRRRKQHRSWTCCARPAQKPRSSPVSVRPRPHRSESTSFWTTRWIPSSLRCPQSFFTRRYATAASSMCSRTISGC
ncbi:hypothetical protein [Streptomyces malaysiensis]|uniref:hypothetical protein n=1 Tax=Streptomyces malaysiensis TaxID=92644 RepID=UPI003690A952